MPYDPIEVEILVEKPTVTAGAYTAEDFVGGLLTFENAYPIGKRGQLLEAVSIIDQADVLDAAAATLILFKHQPSVAIADNAASTTLTDAEAENILGIVQLATTDWDDLGGMAVATKGGVNLPIRAFDRESDDGSQRITERTLYAALITAGTPTFAAIDDVTVQLHMIRS